MTNLLHGDCIEKLKELPDNSVDSIITDPPYELGFMGKSWDNTGIANNIDMWRECFRVLKPGGHLLSFGGTRTYHRMACAIEDAGFEVRDMIEWVYGSGFPKSLNIGKVLDKFLKTGNASWNGTGDSSNGALGYSKLQHKQDYRPEDYSNRHQNKEDITEEKAKEWEGWGTALKPAHEPICMARKPLAEKTVAENVLKYGTGGINIDESRIGTDLIPCSNDIRSLQKWKELDGRKHKELINPAPTFNFGRFPANLIHDNSEEVRDCFPEQKSGALSSKHKIGNDNGEMFNYGIYGKYKAKNFHDAPASSGNASRFFKSIIYTAKASKSERNFGLDNFNEMKVNDGRDTPIDNAFQRGETHRKNVHPTVKPIALMEYLIKMVTPKGGIVLDPFMGSGTTGCACAKLGYNFIGIEREQEYLKIAEARIKSYGVQKTIL